MTPIGVKLRRNRNLYVLVVFAPGRRKTVLSRRIARRPWPLPERGDVLRAARKRVRVRAVATRVRQRDDGVIEHVIEVFTRSVARRRARRADAASNVVRMPTGEASIVAEFLRYHVLVRVFDGDPDAWLAHLRDRGGSGGDVRFARWIRSQLRHDPELLTEIRRMVDATPFWRAAEA